MALIDRPIVSRLLEAAQEYTGVTVAPATEVKRLRVVEQEFGELQQQAEDLAFHTFDYFTGRGQELRPERRRRLAQRSRIALLQDPLAGAEAQLVGDFAFGKGLSIPTARDPKVQDVIDQAWKDSINQQILTSYQAQRKLSNELITAGELFITLYVRGGKVRVGRRDADLVRNIVPDPENENIPLWYVIQERRSEWDFDMDAPKFVNVLEDGRPQVKYWPHWQNVADAIKDRETDPEGEHEEPLIEPPAEKLAQGVVYHLPINQTGDQMRGNPPWARSLRFFSAMNVLTEAHVTVAQAASTFIARRAMKGSPRQITKAASNILASAGELGASAYRATAGWGVAGNAEPTTEPFTQPGQPGPFPPGSWWNENMDSSKLEALNLNSGAAQMAQTAQIVRAPIAASSGFGQHYLGDAQNANLATASTLELPATMHVGSWQEYFEGLYRWFTDRAIEAAIKAGLLGGSAGFDGKPLSEMCLSEAEDRAAMEKRTGKDLGYEFSMPFPGRRQLADVTTFVQLVAATMDPNGVNVPLRRILLRFAFEQVGIDDIARAIEECIPEKGMPGGIGPQAAGGGGASFNPPAAPGAGGAPGAGRTGAGAGAGAADGTAEQPYGAKAGTASGDGSSGALEGEVPAEVAAAMATLESSTSSLFRRMFEDPQVLAAIGGASNGQGS